MSLIIFFQNQPANVTVNLPSVSLSIQVLAPRTIIPGEVVQNIGSTLPSIKRKKLTVKLPRVPVEIQAFAPTIFADTTISIRLAPPRVEVKPLAPTTTVGYDYRSDAYVEDILTLASLI